MTRIASPDSTRHDFRAMGCAVEVIAAAASPDAGEAFAAAEREFHRLEGILSRFRTESELSRLNRSGRIVAGPELLDVVRLALEGRSATDGRFDPTVHDAIVEAGYDRTFEEIVSDRSDARAAPCGGDVEIDERRCSIELEPGFRLDLGGVAKGYAVDRVCGILRTAGGFLVNAGGDLAVTGPLGDGPWPVAAETADAWITLGLTGGALATSGRDVRRWGAQERPRHHLIDPVRGRPAEVDLLRVTTFGETAVEAEIRAKDLFLLGADAARSASDRVGAPTILVTADGRTILAGGLG